MPFLIPLIAPAIGIVGGLIAGKPRPKPWEKQAIQTQTELDKQRLAASRFGLDAAGKVMPMGMDFLSSGRRAFRPAVDYWTKSLKGGPEAYDAIMPDVKFLRDQYAGVRRSQDALYQRSGSGSAHRQQREFDLASQIGGLLPAARQAAATNLGALGTNMSSIGTGVLHTGSNLLRGSTQAGGSPLLNYGLKSREDARKSGAAAGAGLYEMTKDIDWEAVFNRTKKEPT